MSSPFFDSNAAIVTARAPGRLDVMGGISDYSGGLCLEWPLEIATTCLIQATGEPHFVARSLRARGEKWAEEISIGRDELSGLDEAGARTRFAHDAAWGRYVFGALVILKRETGFFPEGGAHLEIDSTVPNGAGVSSSAALEVAVLTALDRLYDLKLGGHRIALLAQQVENRVAGAPCGVMDQMTVSLGQKNRLLCLKCQPDLVQGVVATPPGVEFWGIDSSVKHSVGGGAYGKARCAAFMGRKILSGFIPDALKGDDGQLYLANLRAHVWRALRDNIPETLSGASFIEEYGSHDDEATQIDPHTIYKVRLATEHPIYETDRVAKFVEFLRLADESDSARHQFLLAAGEMMIQSHFSYDQRCDLGSPETDLLVQLARDAGPQQGIYGAKITGGGAGGTVAILADRSENPYVEASIGTIVSEYERQIGIKPQVFFGSSDGANSHY